MGKLLKDFEFSNKAMGAPRLWDRYFDGQVWEIDYRKEGKNATLESLRTSLWASASKLGLSLRTQKLDEHTLAVQAYPREERR